MANVRDMVVALLDETFPDAPQVEVRADAALVDEEGREPDVDTDGSILWWLGDMELVGRPVPHALESTVSMIFVGADGFDLALSAACAWPEKTGQTVGGVRIQLVTTHSLEVYAATEHAPAYTQASLTFLTLT